MIKLEAKPVVESMHKSISDRVSQFKDKFKRAPKISVILVGEDPASAIYTSRKGQAAEKLGMEHETINFIESCTAEEVQRRVEELNHDPKVDGILIQRPLPKQFKEADVLEWIIPHKDVDAFHPENVGKMDLGLKCFKPCTPAGIIALLDHYQIPIEGKHAVVVGRSSIVGKPVANLLLKKNATVTICHSKTQDLRTITSQADILVVAAGRPELINAEHIKKGAAVVDVGIHRNTDGKLVGDVDAGSAAQVASALSPVPGGVGPMTIAFLMENTIKSAEWRESLK